MATPQETVALVHTKLDASKVFEGRNNFRQPSIDLLYVVHTVLTCLSDSPILWDRPTEVANMVELIQSFVNMIRNKADPANFLLDFNAVLISIRFDDDTDRMREAVRRMLICVKLVINDGRTPCAAMAEHIIDGFPNQKLPIGDIDNDMRVLRLLRTQPPVPVISLVDDDDDVVLVE